jgi:hypothetical protein
MGVLIRFRSTDLNSGPLVHYEEATSYAVMADNTVELLDGARNVGAVHSDRWDSVEVVDQTPSRESDRSPGGGC